MPERLSAKKMLRLKVKELYNDIRPHVKRRITDFSSKASDAVNLFLALSASMDEMAHEPLSPSHEGDINPDDDAETGEAADAICTEDSTINEMTHRPPSPSYEEDIKPGDDAEIGEAGDAIVQVITFESFTKILLVTSR